MECPACHTPVDASQRFCPKCGALQPAADAQGGSDPLVGSVLAGRYRIVKLLGEGGMGAVYLGEQQLGTKTRKVAVKTLHPHLSKDPKVKARFNREVGTVAELEHPNTIQVFDFGETEGGILYLVMEFIDGTNVADILEKQGAMDPVRVERIMTQVCGSLEEAHSRGIIHRDLKPENVVLTERAGQKDFVKVLDFGIAKRSNEADTQEQKLTQQGMVLGTPPYMSPEQFTGQPIDARSDIYSLGVMMYEMLTARLPFSANTAWEWATQHMTVPPMALEAAPGGSQIPSRMKAAVMRALEKNKDARFGTVREFADAFASGGAEPVSAAPSVQSAQKGKTQVGEPLLPPGGFGPSPAMGAPPAFGTAPQGGPPAPVVASTPSAGNYAVPAVVPQPPARSEKGSGSRTGIIAAIAVLGIASVGALAYSMMPHGKSSGGGLDFDAGPTQVDLTPTTTPTDTTPAVPTDAGLAALNTPPVHPANPHPGPAHSGAKDAGTKPAPSGGGTAPPGPTTPPPPKPEPPECAEARKLAANPNLQGNPALQNKLKQLTLACTGGGGHL